MMFSISKKLLVSLVLSVSLVSSVPSPYIQNGYGENHYSYLTTTGAYIDTNLNIFGPNVNSYPSGTSFPIIIFLPGFVAQMPTASYYDILAQMASKGNGAIVVGWDGLAVSNVFNLPLVIGRAAALQAWCTQGELQQYVNQNFKTPFTVNTQQIFYASHSSGAQIVVPMSTVLPNNGLILLDPVDGNPNLGTVTTVKGPQTYSKPVMVIQSGLGQVPGITWMGGLEPACVVPGYAGQHFYNSYTQGVKYFYNATYYGHMDLGSNDYFCEIVAASGFCASVANTNTHPYSGYRNFVSGAAASFVAMYSGKDDCTDYQQYLLNPSLFNIQTNYASTLNSAAKYC